MKNLHSESQCGKRVKKLVTAKNFNWKIDVRKLIVVPKIGVKFRSGKMRKKIIIHEEIISRKIDMEKNLKL